MQQQQADVEILAASASESARAGTAADAGGDIAAAKMHYSAAVSAMLTLIKQSGEGSTVHTSWCHMASQFMNRIDAINKTMIERHPTTRGGVTSPVVDPPVAPHVEAHAIDPPTSGCAGGDGSAGKDVNSAGSPPPAKKDIEKRKRKVYNVVKELLSTEETYVGQLQALLREYSGAKMIANKAILQVACCLSPCLRLQ